MHWETELSQYELAAGQGHAMGEKDWIMCLEDMCPEPLQQYLESKKNLVTYADYKLAIQDYLLYRARWAGRSGMNWIVAQEEFDTIYVEETWKIEQSEEAGEGQVIGQIKAFLVHFPQLNAVSGESCALVTNKFGKQHNAFG